MVKWKIKQHNNRRNMDDDSGSSEGSEENQKDDVREHCTKRNGSTFHRPCTTHHNTPTNTACVGCDIVQADHAPDGGVAQGIFHGVLVRHHGRNQEEVEEGLEEEVERREEENAQTTTCTCMDGMR